MNRNSCGIGFGSRYGVCDIGLGAPLSQDKIESFGILRSEASSVRYC
jgi:hypothetical protein